MPDTRLWSGRVWGEKGLLRFTSEGRSGVQKLLWFMLDVSSNSIADHWRTNSRCLSAESRRGQDVGQACVVGWCRLNSKQTHQGRVYIIAHVDCLKLNNKTPEISQFFHMQLDRELPSLNTVSFLKCSPVVINRHVSVIKDQCDMQDQHHKINGTLAADKL